MRADEKNDGLFVATSLLEQLKPFARSGYSLESTSALICGAGHVDSRPQGRCIVLVTHRVNRVNRIG
jgi:hypothetical protein